MMSRAQIEKRWGVRIVDDEPYWRGERLLPLYKIYSADGCTWENGLTSIKAVENECREWSDALLSIKKEVEECRRITAERLAFERAQSQN